MLPTSLHKKPIRSPSGSNCQKTDLKVKRIASHLCAICGDFARGKNFGIISCMACAAFFRSSIVQMRNYSCRKEQKCEITKKSRVCCRCCRFQKCLQKGMQKELVQFGPTADQQLPDDMSINGEETKSPPQNLLKMEIHHLANFEQNGAIQNLLEIEGRAKRIRESATAIPDEYFDRFKTLEQLLTTNINLLNKANNFSMEPPIPWDIAAFRARVEEGGIYGERPRHRVLDHFLIAEMAKTMPVFMELCMEDKLNLLTFINQPIMLLMNAHYSVNHNSETVMAPNGHLMITGFMAQRYSADPRVAKMSERMYCHILEPYKQFALTNEEYVLLLAIFYSHSAAPNLSQHAIQMLYQESINYSQILLQLLQTRLGPLTGANRYAELLQFINHAIQGVEFYKKFKAYMDVFHLKNSRDAVFPKALLQFYKE